MTHIILGGICDESSTSSHFDCQSIRHRRTSRSTHHNHALLSCFGRAGLGSRIYRSIRHRRALVEYFLRYRQPRWSKLHHTAISRICTYNSSCTKDESSVSTEHGRKSVFSHSRSHPHIFRPPSVHSHTGDTIRIHATNGLGDEQLGTAIHSHGMMFNNSNWFDGAVGVTQCPIPPGETLTYDIDTSIQVS